MPRKKNPTQDNEKPIPPGVTISKPRVIQDRTFEAEASFAFLVDVRSDLQAPLAKRIECAEMILDRVFGKPSQGTTDDVPSSAKEMIEKYYEAIGKGSLAEERRNMEGRHSSQAET